MYSAADLKVGTIIDIHDHYFYDEKHKYSIIVGISEDQFYIATVFINSLVNPNAINSKILVNLQFEIKKAQYTFLKKDSYVDCSQITDRLQITLIEQLNSNGRILGQVKPVDLKKIIDLVIASPQVLPYYIKLCNIKAI